MLLNGKYWLRKNKKGELWTNLPDGLKDKKLDESNEELINDAKDLLRTYKRKTTTNFEKLEKLIDFINKYYLGETDIDTNLINLQKTSEDVCSRLIKFFGDFDFKPNYRFINTLQIQNKKSSEEAINYVCHYFELTGNQHFESIKEKIKSYEFKQILNDMTLLNTSTIVNKRFELLYGPQGTGKTTKAMEISKVVIPCHSGMLPADLLEDFKFDDGKAGFNPSSLWKAMEEGTAIVLDEINLLPFESLRFLQTILDNKEEITYKGQTISIRDGFKIIGTMNLYVNGDIFTLPEPLVDRCKNITSLELTAHDLVGALL